MVAPAARLVAQSGALDLDDVRAKIPEQHRAVRACERLTQFDDAHIIQNVFRGHGA